LSCGADENAYYPGLAKTILHIVEQIKNEPKNKKKTTAVALVEQEKVYLFFMEQENVYLFF
jgi:hypothetical protein